MISDDHLCWIVVGLTGVFTCDMNKLCRF